MSGHSVRTLKDSELLVSFFSARWTMRSSPYTLAPVNSDDRRLKQNLAPRSLAPTTTNYYHSYYYSQKNTFTALFRFGTEAVGRTGRSTLGPHGRVAVDEGRCDGVGQLHVPVGRALT